MGSRDFRIDRDMVFAVMKHTGKTETSVAKALCVTVVAVCKWLDDSHCITLRTAQKLARELDVPIRMIIKEV